MPSLYSKRGIRKKTIVPRGKKESTYKGRFFTLGKDDKPSHVFGYYEPGQYGFFGDKKIPPNTPPKGYVTIPNSEIVAREVHYKRYGDHYRMHIGADHLTSYGNQSSETFQDYKTEAEAKKAYLYFKTKGQGERQYSSYSGG